VAVLDSGATLKTIKQAEYRCVLCAEDATDTRRHREVTFHHQSAGAENPAHDPETLPFIEYYRQVFWSSGVDLPMTRHWQNGLKKLLWTPSSFQLARR